MAIHLTETQSVGIPQLQFNDNGLSSELTWKKPRDDHQQAFFKYDTEKAKVYIGWNLSDHYELGKVSLNNLDGKRQYFLFAVVNRDGSIGGKGRYIMTLAGMNL
jgi:hypothetical protein